MTDGCIKEAEFSLLIRKEDEFQVIKPSSERGSTKKVKFERSKNMILVILGLKNVDDIHDEVERVFVRKTITDLNKLCKKFILECYLRDEF